MEKRKLNKNSTPPSAALLSSYFRLREFGFKKNVWVAFFCFSLSHSLLFSGFYLFLSKKNIIFFFPSHFYLQFCSIFFPHFLFQSRSIFTQPPLQYDVAKGLAPIITPLALDLHYNKHHATYVANANRLVEGLFLFSFDDQKKGGKKEGEERKEKRERKRGRNWEIKEKGNVERIEKPRNRKKDQKEKRSISSSKQEIHRSKIQNEFQNNFFFWFWI